MSWVGLKVSVGAGVEVRNTKKGALQRDYSEKRRP